MGLVVKWWTGLGLRAGLTAVAMMLMAASTAAAETMPTCTITAIRMVASPASAEPGVELLTAGQGAPSGCFGTYTFYGVSPARLGYPTVTTSNYGELAGALRHWSSIDGVPAVSEWVDLSPAVAAGMESAGLNPTLFLQWVNEFDGKGTVSDPEMPPTWPPFLPKGLVKDPATIAGGTANQSISAPAQEPPPAATQQQAVRPTPVPTSNAVSGLAIGTGPSSQSTPGIGPSPTTAGVSTVSTMPAPRAPVPEEGGATVAPHMPPHAVTTSGVAVPCVVASTCRQATLAHDRWVASPWYAKAVRQIWWHRWWEIGVLLVGAAGAMGARALLIGRRNLAWYGNIRGPR